MSGERAWEGVARGARTRSSFLNPLVSLHPSSLSRLVSPPGALYGTYEAFRYKVPGIHKVRYIGQTTLSSAAVFGLFLGAGSLLQCGRAR